MSTKSKKRYLRMDFSKARKKSSEVCKFYSKKYTRRKTIQVRVSQEIHKKLKEMAREDDLVLSFLLDQICEHFFRNYKPN